MLYSAARPLIRSGDVIAFSGKTLVDTIIRDWTGSDYNHVGIAWWLGLRLMYLYAQGGQGVVLAALSRETPFFWLTTGTVWTEPVETLALDRLGLPYDYLDAIRVGLGRAPVHEDRVCSVYAATILQAAGIAIPLIGCTPDKLVSTLMARSGELREVVADAAQPI